MDIGKMEALIGSDAKSLLEHRCLGISKERLHLPGPDWVERIFCPSDRSIRVLQNLTTILSTGRLAKTGYLSILSR